MKRGELCRAYYESLGWSSAETAGGKMIEYSKRLHQFFDMAEGFGIVTLGITLLVVLVAVAALILHFAW